MIYATIFLKGKIQFRLLICAIPFLIVSVINVMIVEVISIMESESVGNLVTNINFSFMIGFFVSKILFYLLLEQVKKLIKNSFQYLQTVQIIIISVLIIYSVIMEFLYSLFSEQRTRSWNTDYIGCCCVLWNYFFKRLYDLFYL